MQQLLAVLLFTLDVQRGWDVVGQTSPDGNWGSVEEWVKALATPAGVAAVVLYLGHKLVKWVGPRADRIIEAHITYLTDQTKGNKIVRRLMRQQRDKTGELVSCTEQLVNQTSSLVSESKIQTETLTGVAAFNKRAETDHSIFSTVFTNEALYLIAEQIHKIAKHHQIDDEQAMERIHKVLKQKERD